MKKFLCVLIYMQLIDIIIVICILIFVKVCFFKKVEKLENTIKKKVRFNGTQNNKDQQCRRYFDERLTKPLVPEFEKLTVAENPTLQEVFDRHVVDYRKMVPNKQKLDNENEILSTGAYGNTNYTIDQVQYVDENPMNGGQLDNNFYGFDPKFNQDYSVF